MSVVMKRRSIREFKETEISAEKIEALLRSAMQAPSANNQQPWNFIVVTDREKLLALSKMSRGSWPLETATLAIIPVMIPTIKSPLMRVQDIAASTQNILLEAVEQNLGGVWIGVNPIKERIAFVTEIFPMGKEYTPFCIIALGDPKEQKEVIPRYDETRIHYNQWKE